MKSRASKSRETRASRLWSPPAALLAALLLTSCATRNENSRPDSPPAAENLEAVFVESSGPRKPGPLAALGSFFRNLLPEKSPKPPAASPVLWAGEIRMVNVAENFVLVESRAAASAVPGEKYSAIRDRRETGVLRMTALRNPPFLIADIVSGNPSPGDKIHLFHSAAPPSGSPDDPAASEILPNSDAAP